MIGYAMRAQCLETDLARVQFHERHLGWWRRLWRRPSTELRRAVVDLHTSHSRLSGYLEHGNPSPDEYAAGRLLLECAYGAFMQALRQFPSLNVWSYVVSARGWQS